jgi:MFS transporter, DHA1 family, multidrug resistance protein
MQRERFNREFIILCALGAFAIFGSTMSKSPTLSYFANFLGASPAEIGLIAAASTVIGIFTNVFAGVLSDLYGRKKMILVATIVFATAPFLYFLVTNPLQLILVRVYHGLATATLAPVMSATIADMYASRRGEMMSFITSAQYVGRFLAPIVSTSILTLIGLSFVGFDDVYLLCGISGIIAFVLALSLFLFPTVKSAPIQRRTVIQNLRGMPRQTGFLSVGSAMASLYLSVGPVETFLPLYANSIGILPAEVGILAALQSVMILLTGPIFGRLSDRLGRRKFVMIGLGMVALSIVFISFSSSFPLLLLVMVLYGAGMAMTLASAPPMVSELVSKEVYGVSLGALATIQDVGQTLGPIVAGLAIGLSGGLYFDSFILIGGIIGINLGILNLALRLKPKNQQNESSEQNPTTK